MYRRITYLIIYLLISLNLIAQEVKEEKLHKIAYQLSNSFINTKGKNQLISPYSLYQISSMLTNASQNATQNELIQFLGFKSNEIVLLNSYNIDLNNSFSKEVVNANALWFPKGYSLNTPFKKILEDNYNARVKAGDFSNKSEKITKTINQWFYENTDFKIKEMIESVSPMDKLIVMNALYFKSLWELPFDTKMTYSSEFNLENEEKVQVDYLSNTSEVQCYKDAKLELLILPYIGDFEFLIYKSTEINFNIYDWLLNHPLENRKVHYELPKFEIHSEVECIELLKDNGVQLAFQSGADFSFLFKKTEKDLFISTMLQKNYLKLDEKGTVAVAASVAKVSRSLDMKEYDEFLFNSPFIFIIQHSKTKEPLFIGKINNPTLN